MTLRSVGDSILGELVIGDSASSDRSILRGTARANAWTVYAEEPAPRGLSVMLVPIEMAMEWLRETVHGIQPRSVRFEMIVRGDSLTGTRIATGSADNRARTSAVRGMRRK